MAPFVFALLAAGGSGREAGAQEPGQAPNVLLLVDASATMDEMPEGAVAATCSPGEPWAGNRWARLVQALTGSVADLRCHAADRRSSAFTAEFGIDGHPPYDHASDLPFHRLLSRSCTFGAGSLPAGLYDFPAGAIALHRYDDPAHPCPSTEWVQATDGVIDVLGARVRFGMLAPDALSDPATGVSGGATDAAGGLRGQWSYFTGWKDGSGAPASATIGGTSAPFEIGVRNPIAPPWEGRLLVPGSGEDTAAAVALRNQRLELALLALRPFGASPLAAMLADVHALLHEDASTDPLDPTRPFSPGRDPRVLGGCRRNYVLLVSDGGPDLDLRPDCEQAGASCPYDPAVAWAERLAKPADPRLAAPVFVVGVGLGAPGGVDCAGLEVPASFAPSGPCPGASGALRACCELTRLAHAGGTGRARFADDVAALRAQVTELLTAVAAHARSRTLPVPAPAPPAERTGTADAAGYQFVSGLVAEPSGWRGQLERRRYVCEEDGTSRRVRLQPPDAARGDDFARNLTAQAARPRRFVTLVPRPDESAPPGGRASLRPFLTGDPDGVGDRRGESHAGEREIFVALAGARPALFGLSKIEPVCHMPGLDPSSPSGCARRLVRWHLGGDNGAGAPSRVGRELGAVHHATPEHVGPPGAVVADVSHRRFTELAAKRPPTLHAVTTDGQLHCFKVAGGDEADPFKVDRLENNELWSYLPAFALPGIAERYDRTERTLLDGAPVVRDVVFERTLAGARAAEATWRTVLVAGAGGGGGFYYALDVTDPGSPTVLWQLAADAQGRPLFGRSTPRPAIATVFVARRGQAPREIAVAILAGGEGAPPTDSKCTRPRRPRNVKHIDPRYPPRKRLPCYPNDPARSLTIVRLDNGEVLMRLFGRSGDDDDDDDDHGEEAEGEGHLRRGRSRHAPFQAPIAGEPLAYPAGPGKVASRVYVGDAEGRLWRVDLADPRPRRWRADLAWDAHALAGDEERRAAPLLAAPAVAVDGRGATVLVFASGQAEPPSAPGAQGSRLWSVGELAERVGRVRFRTTANWVVPFEGGKQVVGPVALADGAAYFATREPVADACGTGRSALWGVDYRAAADAAAGPYPLPRLRKSDDEPAVHAIEAPPGSEPSGVVLTAAPSCVRDEEIATGAGSASALAGGPPGLSLVFHAASGATVSAAAAVESRALSLASPSRRVRVAAWASITE
jgi:type IV pilus assembly protein PilY1